MGQDRTFDYVHYLYLLIKLNASDNPRRNDGCTNRPYPWLCKVIRFVSWQLFLIVPPAAMVCEILLPMARHFITFRRNDSDRIGFRQDAILSSPHNAASPLMFSSFAGLVGPESITTAIICLTTNLYSVIGTEATALSQFTSRFGGRCHQWETGSEIFHLDNFNQMLNSFAAQ